MAAADGADGKTDIASLSEGASTTLAGKFGGRGLHFAGQVFLARTLGPERFGLYALGAAVLGMLRVISPLGMENGVLRFGARFWPENRPALKTVVIRSLVIGVAASAVVGLALFVLAGPIAQHIFDEPRVVEVLRLFAVACPLAAAVRVASAATRIPRRMVYSVLVEDVAQPSVAVVFFVAAHVFGWGVLGAAAMTLASFGVAVVFALILLGRAFPGLAATPAAGGTSVRELVSFAAPSALAASLSVFLVLVDRIVIGHFRPVAEVGVYLAISQVSMLFMVILNAINTIFSSLVPTLDSREQRARLAEILRVSTKWAVYLSLPPTLVLCLLPHEAIAVVFGAKYAAGEAPLRILALAQICYVAVGPIGLTLIMTGRQNQWLVLTVMAFLSAVGLNLVLVPRLGVTGAASSTLIATGFLLGSGTLMVRKIYGFWPIDPRFLKGCAASAGAALCLVGLRAFGPRSALLTLIAGAVLAVAVFGGLLVILKLDAEDRTLLASLRARYARATRKAT